MSEKNSCEYLPLVQYTFSWPSGPSHVSLCGQFDLEGISNWSEIPLEWQDSDNCFQLKLLLSGPKHVDFKFVVDGEWVCSPHLQTRPDSCGFINNYIFVEPTAQAVESKATTPETLVEIQPEEAKWCESPLSTNENSNEKNCEYKEPEKIAAEEKSPLILPTEVQECPEKHANLELNLNTLDAFEYQFMGFQEEQDNDSSDSSCISPSSSEDSLNLSHKESSSDSINIPHEESETDSQPQCSEHSAGESHLMTYEDLDVNSLTSQATDIQCAEESGTDYQPQCSENATEESQMMSCEDLNVNSLISQATDIQYVDDSNENNEECETKPQSDSEGEPEELENDQEPEDTKSSQETQEDTVLLESDVVIDKAANQLRNEAIAGKAASFSFQACKEDDTAACSGTKSAESDSPNSTLASEQVEFTRSQFFEQHVEDDESKSSIPMVLCSLTLSYIFYGMLAVSTIAAKKSLTTISSKVLDLIQNHSEEAVKMTEHTAYEVHELNIFEILMGLTLVASGMIVAYVVSSFKPRT